MKLVLFHMFFVENTSGARRCLAHGATAVARLIVPVGNHSFRATGITAYLNAGGTLEKCQAMAAHESPRTTTRTATLINRTSNPAGAALTEPPYAADRLLTRTKLPPRMAKTVTREMLRQATSAPRPAPCS
jgi:hypothetical protein